VELPLVLGRNVGNVEKGGGTALHPSIPSVVAGGGRSSTLSTSAFCERRPSDLAHNCQHAGRASYLARYSFSLEN
jgi:hypothetical protein